MYLLQIIVPMVQFDFRAQVPIAIILFTLGACLVIVSGHQFRKVKTTVNPLSPEQTTSLVITGFYRYTRNPMYLGFFLFLVAWAVYLGNVLAPLLLPVFVWILTNVQIKPEEKILESKFGDEYLEYSNNVRRWL